MEGRVWQRSSDHTKPLCLLYLTCLMKSWWLAMQSQCTYAISTKSPARWRRIGRRELELPLITRGFGEYYECGLMPDSWLQMPLLKSMKMLNLLNVTELQCYPSFELLKKVPLLSKHCGLPAVTKWKDGDALYWWSTLGHRDPWKPMPFSSISQYHPIALQTTRNLLPSPKNKWTPLMICLEGKKLKKWVLNSFVVFC